MRAGWHAPIACQSVRVCSCERLCCAAAAWPEIAGWASAGSWCTMELKKGGFFRLDPPETMQIKFVYAFQGDLSVSQTPFK
jgi:hypothetical protein